MGTTGQRATVRRSSEVMDLRDQFTAGRLKMRDAFVAVCDLARRAGVDEDVITGLQGKFFDGNVEVREAVKALTEL